MELNQLRSEIDAVDRELIKLFEKRMDISRRIGLYKCANGLPVYDPAREREKLEQIASLADETLAPYAGELYEKLFELSRRLQEEK